MIDELRQNVETEIEILREISNNFRRLEYASQSERKLLITSIESLRSSLRLINSSLPKMLADINAASKLPQGQKVTSLEKVEFKKGGAVMQVTIESKDRDKLLQELSINDNLVRRLKKKQIEPGEKFDELKAPRGYLKIANKFFLDTAQKLIAKGYFKKLSYDIRKANIDILFAAYIALALFTSFIFIFISLAAMIFFIFFSPTLIFPFVVPFKGEDIVMHAVKLLWMPIVIPFLVFFAFIFYPSTERDSLSKKIDRELPFAVIHMSAISGSGIEPAELFKIIGLSKEYPYLRKEIRKVLNQINLYGYDLVTALNNVTKTTPSSKLAELFGGLSTTITSGSSLQDFFEKRSETLLVAYRLEREKYNKVAETFMDIYISVVIAAPMILMILLVMVLVLGVSNDLSANELAFLAVGVIGLINAVFIGILHLKQPNY